MNKKKFFGFLMVLVLLVGIVQVSTVSVVLAGNFASTGTGLSDDFSEANGTLPADWVVSGAGTGDSVGTLDGTLQMVKTTTPGTMTITRNNLNLDANANGKIIVEFEAQFPAIGAGYSANGKFPLIYGIKEDGVSTDTPVNAFFDGTAKLYAYHYEYGAGSTNAQVLWKLDNLTLNPSTMWHKMTYVIDTATDTYSVARTDESADVNGVAGFPGTQVRITDALFSDNAKYKTISNIQFTMPAGTSNTTTYKLRNFKVYPYAPTTTPNATFGGINETFSYPVDSKPSFADGWAINGLRTGDSIAVKDDPSVAGGKMLSIFKAKTDTSTYLDLTRNNLNLDVNAGGQIKVEFEAQFPNIKSNYYAYSFPYFFCVDETNKLDTSIKAFMPDSTQVSTKYFEKPSLPPVTGASQFQFLWALNSADQLNKWNKMTYIIDTDSDDYSTIRNDTINRLSNVAFESSTVANNIVTNKKIKSLNNLNFKIRNSSGAYDCTYNIRNLKVTPVKAPTLMSSTPVNGASLTGTQNSITLNFNTDIDPLTLTTSNITVAKGAGQTALTNMLASEYSVIPTIDGITGKCTSATINFTKNLSNITEYKVTVGKNVTSLLGVPVLVEKTLRIVPSVQLTAFSVTGAATTSVTASVSLKNYSASPQATTFIVAAYDKLTGALMGAEKTTATINSNVAAVAVPLTLTLPTAGTNYTIKGYLWDSETTMIPLKPGIPLQ